MRRISRIWPLFALILGFGVVYGYLFAVRDADVPRLVQTAGDPSAIENIEISYIEYMGIKNYGNIYHINHKRTRKISFFNGETAIEHGQWETSNRRQWQFDASNLIYLQIVRNNQPFFESIAQNVSDEERNLWEKMSSISITNRLFTTLPDDSILCMVGNNKARAYFIARLDRRERCLTEYRIEDFDIRLIAIEPANGAEYSRQMALGADRILEIHECDDRVVIQLRNYDWALLDELSCDQEIYDVEIDNSGERPTVLLTLLDSEKESQAQTFRVFELMNDRLIERYSVRKSSQEWRDLGISAVTQPFCWRQGQLYVLNGNWDGAQWSYAVNVFDEAGKLLYQGEILDYAGDDEIAYSALNDASVLTGQNRNKLNFTVTLRGEGTQ